MNLGDFPPDSEIGTPFIDIKTFELNVQLTLLLNFERFDINFTFFIQMSYAKLEIAETKHQELVWNVLEM